MSLVTMDLFFTDRLTITESIGSATKTGLVADTATVTESIILRPYYQIVEDNLLVRDYISFHFPFKSIDLEESLLVSESIKQQLSPETITDTLIIEETIEDVIEEVSDTLEITESTYVLKSIRRLILSDILMILETSTVEQYN